MKSKLNDQILSEILNNIDSEEIKSFVVESRVNRLDRNKRREEYVKKNTNEWVNKGKALKARRIKHKISMKRVAEKLGTSATRIGRLEKGDPVSMADHLTKTYNMLFDYIELKKKLRGFFLEHALNWRI